ncbi:MAG TPA: PLDc N-terminal domain-containing protein [Methanomassiliicoccales archaeon]|nr:PLDc N-terminal domain-containing protein [Methanomassiliicoccales archaeon]
MLEWYFLTLIAWLFVGVLCASIVYVDMRALKRIDVLWILVVFLIPIIGIIVYFLLVRGRPAPYAYPPKTEYPTPEYKFGQKAEPQKKDAPSEAKKVEQVEGIPRCPDCGAAISMHDEKCPKCGRKLKDY